MREQLGVAEVSVDVQPIGRGSAGPGEVDGFAEGDVGGKADWAQQVVGCDCGGSEKHRAWYKSC